MSEREERALGERVASLETDMERLMGNGQPGLIAQIQEDMERNAEFVRKLDKKMLLIGLGLIVAVFAAGSGTGSLKSVIDLIAKMYGG